MTAAQKVLEITKQIAAVNDAFGLDEPGSAADLLNQEKVLDLEKEKRQAEKTAAADHKKALKDAEPNLKAAKAMDVNSLQKIGGFLGSYNAAPEVVLLETQKKSEGHLAQIKKDIAAMRVATGGASAGGVEF